MINYENENEKIEVLLHYEKSFREDWRFLSKLRVLTGGVFVGLITSIIGWALTKHDYPLNCNAKIKLIVIILSIVIIAVGTLGWFASSLNVLKRFMVSIQFKLGMYEKNIFGDKEVIYEKYADWGDRDKWLWGKAVIACILLGSLFVLAIILVL